MFISLLMVRPWTLARLGAAILVLPVLQTPVSAQGPDKLAPVIVSAPKSDKAISRPGSESGTVRLRARPVVRAQKPAPAVTASWPLPDATALNLGIVATSATHLGLTVFETPASVQVVGQQEMQEQGYRTTTEAAQGAVGVLSGDAGGAPAGFSMRGFSGSAVTVLYNGIWIGPQDITSRVLDTSNLQQVEFLKGPSSVMSGVGVIGGAVNYVSRQPTSGPVRNELDTSIDTLGTYRTHFGSGGSTTAPGLDYRFDLSSSKINSFIDGDYQRLNNVAGQLNYRISDAFKIFGAVEYNQDGGHAYWGTPMTTTTFSGPFSTRGIVSGSAINTFDGSVIAPVTVDSRTLRTNYNVADNTIGARELWLRGGFELALNKDVTIKSQAYGYGARRHWFDSETYAFNTGTSLIDRDRFFVDHRQQVTGDTTDLTWDSVFFGMQNRFAAQACVSRNEIRFAQEQNPADYPFDSVSVVDPVPGLYTLTPEPGIRNSRLDDAALTIEDRLKITPMLALIGSIRVDHLTLSRSGSNFDGTIPAGQPFTQTWDPVSYRAGATLEPVNGLIFYGMYATAYDPAAARIFSVTPGTSLELTSARIYETGVKAISTDKRAEFTFAAYDIERKNVYVALTNAVATLAGSVHSQGIEIAAAARPVTNVKIWGNVAITQARYGDFDVWTGNTPSNVAPVIINAGASYRFADWRWPLELGASVRHVGQRFLFEDDLTTMLPYTTADLYAFTDIPGRDLWWQGFEAMRVSFRIRNLTNTRYAAWSDPGYPDQVYLGAPRTFELAASAKW